MIRIPQTVQSPAALHTEDVGTKESDILSPSPPPSRSRRSNNCSEMCESYQLPRPTHHLRGNLGRYGCKPHYVNVACGVVPTLHPIINAPNYKTWYANEFGVGRNSTGKNRRPPTPAICPLHLPPLQPDTISKSAKTQQGGGGGGGRKKISFGGPEKFSWLSEWAGPV